MTNIDHLLNDLSKAINSKPEIVRSSPLKEKSLLIEMTETSTSWLFLVGRDRVDVLSRDESTDVDTDFWVRMSKKVLEKILVGEMDPLTAIMTRKIQTNLTPLTGPSFRALLIAGQQRTESDMGWKRAFNLTFKKP